jgi:septal ring factor EnvC (AmiA/AmiB activator)
MLRISLALALTCMASSLIAAGALAETAGAAPAPSPAKVVQVAAAEPAKPGGAPADAEALPERVDALEKENTVLREDLGKARLDARAQLEAAARRQAEAIAALNRQVDDLEKQLQAERDRQSRRNRNLWLAVGVVALGVLVSD